MKESPKTLAFGTKSQTLSRLADRLTKSRVGESLAFTVDEWAERSERLTAEIRDTFLADKVIVRSSALGEDAGVASMAGEYESVLDVETTDGKALVGAVERVIASYGPQPNGRDEVLVQRMITDVSMSGVIFTHDLNTGAPYYVVNYDDTSGRTDSVTSGTTDTSRTLLIHRNHVEMRSGRFNALLRAVEEVEALFNGAALDIEFAVTSNDEIHLLQVRQLAVRKNWNRQISLHVDRALVGVDQFLVTKFQPTFGALGNRSLFGEMPDWNPAEIIGSVPRPLARSLYEMLIMDSVWAEARAEMGYRNQAGRPLMVEIGGRAYVDVRESFNSYLPASLPDSIGEKLVSSWLDYLQDHPEEHDKIEFNVAVTTFTFDFQARLDIAKPDLDENEREQVERAYRTLTQDVISGDGELLDRQFERVERLDQQRRKTLGGGVPGQELVQARELLRDCVALGTLPFAILARCGFIAEALLRSCTSTGSGLADVVDRVRGSVSTVLTEFLTGLHLVASGQLDEAEFLADFGHLRPGTYDILALRYDQRDDLVGTGSGSGSTHQEAAGTHEPLSDDDLRLLREAMSDADLVGEPEELVRFIKRSIEGREYSKLVFTRNLSDAMELIAIWGERNNLSREELSFLTISQILRSLSSTYHDTLEDQYRGWIQEARTAYEISHAIRLPYLISDPSDAHVIPLLKSKANFITQDRVDAPLCLVTGRELEPLHADGQIVLIERADPGYDWIFVTPIAGLITRYGGSNSHMAIRCAELSIPAAIGCGEQQFAQLLTARRAVLDCAAGVITAVG